MDPDLVLSVERTMDLDLVLGPSVGRTMEDSDFSASSGGLTEETVKNRMHDRKQKRQT